MVITRLWITQGRLLRYTEKPPSARRVLWLTSGCQTSTLHPSPSLLFISPFTGGHAQTVRQSRYSFCRQDEMEAGPPAAVFCRQHMHLHRQLSAWLSALPVLQNRISIVLMAAVWTGYERGRGAAGVLVWQRRKHPKMPRFQEGFPLPRSGPVLFLD